MLGYLSVDIICSEKWTVFREWSSRKTVSYKEQIMSKDKYPSIFSPLQIFIATRIVLKIGEYSRIFPSFSWGIFGHVTRLGQWHASKKIWWIVMVDICRAVKRQGKYPPLSLILRWIIVLVYTAQAEKLAAQRVTLFVTIYWQKPFCFSSAAWRWIVLG